MPNSPTIRREQLGDHISDLMREKHVTSVQLAEELRIPTTTLKSWLARNSFPKDSAGKILTALGVAISGGELGLMSRFEFNQGRTYNHREKSKNFGRERVHQLGDLTYESESYFELQRYLKGIQGGAESYIVGVVGSTMTGKSRLVSELLDLIRISYDLSNPDPLIDQLTTSLSHSINRDVQARTFSALANQLIDNIGSFRGVLIDPIDGGDRDSRANVFELIDNIRTRTKGRIVVFTDSTKSRDATSFIENKVYADTQIRSLKAFTYSDLSGIVELHFPEISKQIARKLIEAIQEFGSHRSLTYTFLETFKKSSQDMESIQGSQEETHDALKKLIFGSYTECLIIANFPGRAIETLEGERVVEFSEHSLDWIQIQHLLETTLFQLRGNKLTTTPLIYRTICENKL